MEPWTQQGHPTWLASQAAKGEVIAVDLVVSRFKQEPGGWSYLGKAKGVTQGRVPGRKERSGLQWVRLSSRLSCPLAPFPGNAPACGREDTQDTDLATGHS